MQPRDTQIPKLFKPAQKWWAGLKTGGRKGRDWEGTGKEGAKGTGGWKRKGEGKERKGGKEGREKRWCEGEGRGEGF